VVLSLCVSISLGFIFHESMKPANGKKSGAQFCISPFLSHQFGIEIHWRSILNFMRNALRSNDGFQSDIFCTCISLFFPSNTLKENALKIGCYFWAQHAKLVIAAAAGTEE